MARYLIVAAAVAGMLNGGALVVPAMAEETVSSGSRMATSTDARRYWEERTSLQGLNFQEVDTNGDGYISIEEAKAHPRVVDVAVVRLWLDITDQGHEKAAAAEAGEGGLNSDDWANMVDHTTTTSPFGGGTTD